MGTVARAGHPALYDRGWHPTAVCGVVGSATAGVSAARLASSGATVPTSLPTAPAGFEAAYGGRWAEPDPARLAIADNWIKAFPCCLQAHSAIEAAEACRKEGASLKGSQITVHPVSTQAAPYEDVETGLQTKFSIPYLAAFTFLHGPVGVDDFGAIDSDARSLASTLRVATDSALIESEAVILTDAGFEARVPVALGSPQRPLQEDQLAAKVRALAGEQLQGVLDSTDEPARDLLDALGL